MEPRDYWWNAFMETGRVDAYLEYKMYQPHGSLPQSVMGVRPPDETKNRRHRPTGLQNRG